MTRKLKQCDTCTLGKHRKLSFHGSHTRAHRNLELIHSDLSGTMSVLYSNGNKYMINFIDGYNRICWVYMLSNKYKAFETFKKNLVWIETNTQSNIDSTCVDNGKEYASNEF